MPDDLVPVLAVHYGRRTSTVVHAFVPGTGITYAPITSPDTPLGWADLHHLHLDERALHRIAFGNLNAMIDTVSLHGGPPALMASFHGIESSLLLADVFWAERVPELPGTPVVAVPARDVLVITGSQSPSGLAKAHRCVERVMFAGPHHSLVPDLLERRDNRWHVFDESPPPEEESAGSWDDQYEAGYERWSTPEDRRIAPRHQEPYHGRPNYA
jgi:hypothetical protein